MNFMDETALEAALQEPRLIVESGIEAQIGAVVTDIVVSLGFRLVRIKLSGRDGLTLQIMFERPDGSLTIEDCDLLSATISPVLDVADLIDGHYNLEVSSPGIDRPLVRHSDFVRALGQEIKIETIVSIDGRQKFRGCVNRVEENGFEIQEEAEDSAVFVVFDQLKQARLVLTDELIRAALKADKRLREDDGTE